MRKRDESPPSPRRRRTGWSRWRSPRRLRLRWSPSAAPPGSGRTTLLRDVVARLQRDAVWVDCSVFAHRTPWRSLHEAVSSTSPRVFPAEMAAELADRLAPSPAPDEIGALIWSVISSGVPVMGTEVVVLDDFDLLDPASQGVASYLLQRVAQFGRVPVVVSVASGAERVAVTSRPSTSNR